MAKTKQNRGISKVELAKSEDEKGKYLKVCVGCKKSFTSNARGTRFCCNDCRIKYNARIKKDRERYKDIAHVERVRVAAHNLAVKVMQALEEMMVIEHKCAYCDEVEGIECHHLDLDFLNNNPDNLVWVCRKHHTQLHSEHERKVAAGEIKMYKDSMKPFMDTLTKLED